MAGLLAYAAEGAVAGAGKGIEQAGATLLKDQVDQGLARLQNDYATTRQQAGFAHEETMQGKQQSFEKGLKEEEIQASTNTATAARQERAAQATEHETAATERARIAAASRTGAAKIRADAAGAGKNAPKPWKVQNVNVYPTKADGTPDYAAPAQQKPLLFNPNNNALYAPVGDKLIRWNSDTNRPAIDPKVLSRTPIDPGELQRLYSDPNGIIPSAFKGGGLTNLENFERVHHFIPAGIGARVMQGGMVNNNNPDAAGADQPNEEGNEEATQQQIENDDNAPAKEPGE
jgi:hypothetical protein